MNEFNQGKYEASLNFLALLASPYGEEIRKNNPELVEEAQRIVTKYQTDYMETNAENSEVAKTKLNDISEFKGLLEILPETEYTAIKEINIELENTVKELQDELLFQPKAFFDQYFLVSQSKHNDMVFDNTANERFKLWFGGSKVVDKDGKPLIVYHGTSGSENEFSRFDTKNFPAVYWAENRSYSEWFAKARGGNGYVLECYLRILNPIDFSELYIDKLSYDDFVTYVNIKHGYKLPLNEFVKSQSDQRGGLWGWQYIRYAPDWIEMFKETKEFDGFLYYENNPDDKIKGKDNVTKAWLAFNDNAYKVADIRNVTYSLFDNNINRKKGGKI